MLARRGWCQGLEIRYFRSDFLRDSGDSRCGWSRLYSLLRSMVSAVLQGPPCPGVRAHVVFFRGIHLPHRSCPIQARYISDSSALRCDTLNQVFENCGRSSPAVTGSR